MTRKKVKLTYITNDSARKATYKKRKKGLMKKVDELTTLCDIDACAIIYSPYDSQPEVWPSPLGVQRVLEQFKTMPEMEQSKKMVNQETFLRQRINKALEQLKKQKKDNREKEMARVMFHSLTGKPLQGLTMSDLTDLGWVIDHHLKEIHLRMKNIKEDVLKCQQDQVQGAVHVVPAATSDHIKSNGEGSSSNNMAMKSGEEDDAAPVKQPFDHMNNMEAMQLQMIHHQMASHQKQQLPWFMDMNNMMNDPPPVVSSHPNHNHPMGFTGEDMMLSFTDHSHTSTMWPNPPSGGFNFP